jgi:hypothetical protein
MARENVLAFLGVPTSSAIAFSLDKTAREHAIWRRTGCDVEVVFLVEYGTVEAVHFIEPETSSLDRIRGWLSLGP